MQKYSLHSWGSGGALIAQESHPRFPDEGVPLVGIGSRRGFPQHTFHAVRCGRPEELGPVLSFSNGSLLAAFEPECEVAPVIERWSSPSSVPQVQRFPIDIDAGAKSFVVEGFEGDRPDDVTAFGYEYCGGGSGGAENPDHAYLAHFDGHAWTKEMAPPDTETVTAYVSDESGSAWAIADRQDHARLWRKAANGPWELVPLPRLGSIDVQLRPTRLSRAEDGSVWVWCRVRMIDRAMQMHGPYAVVLSTLAPSRLVAVDDLW